MRPEHPVALITGASWGIGEATARALAADGFHLALGARSVDRVSALATELAARHAIQAWGGPLDVRDGDSVATFMDRAASRLGDVHVLVNNAGLARGLDRIEDVREADWDEMIRTNVEGVLRMTRACLPVMRRAGWGHVFFLGSTASHGVYEGGAVYCGTKHFVRAVSETLRLELLGLPIRITSIDPGMVETEFSVTRLGSRERADAVYRGMEPLAAADIAECIRWAVGLPDRVNIDQILVKPRDQAAFHRVHRRT